MISKRLRLIFYLLIGEEDFANCYQQRHNLRVETKLERLISSMTQNLKLICVSPYRTKYQINLVNNREKEGGEKLDFD